jgi:hypothetical protein
MQLNVKQGIQKFGEAGVKAVLKELKQLHAQKVIEPKHPEKLSHKQRSKTL